MIREISPPDLLKELISSKGFLIVQDIDGVCIPLVKDPLNRKLEISYIDSASKLHDEFAVLTNGEHGGPRGVNRIIEKAFSENHLSLSKGKYLPGLAAGGIEYQNHFGEIEYPGVSENELEFLNKIPKQMIELLQIYLSSIFRDYKKEDLHSLAKASVLTTKFSPTINLNKIFNLTQDNVMLQKNIQIATSNIMNKIIDIANEEGLDKSFYLHVAPNLGKEGNKEKIKFATDGDVGTTDIQLMLTGAIKEAGLLVLINKYVQKRFGRQPLGKNFNVRNAPRSIKDLKSLCVKNFSSIEMPILIGIGDTVTSNYCSESKRFLRGGSDRGFLTLIQELGVAFKKENRVILVDSSGGEVDRPSLTNKNFKGITDTDDPLKFNTYFRGGPSSYVEWFNQLAKTRKP